MGFFARVIDPDTQATIALYADNNGTPIASVSGVADMAKTDSLGNLSIYVETAGSYHLDVYDTNGTTFVRRYERLQFGDSGFRQAGAGTIQRSSEAKLRETVSVTDFAGCDPTGATDSTAAFQAAHDAFPDGVEILVPPGLYLVSRVNITNQNVTFRLSPAATIKKYGSGGNAARGIFDIRNLIDCNFVLTGGTIDLNGEGPMEIGVAGRIPNTYALAHPDLTPIKIAGPLNAAIFALRSSGITVTETNIANTGETGLLFRNCGDVLVDWVSMWNVANWGVEFNPVASGGDGGTGPMPQRGRLHVRKSTFADVDDYGLGAGNGGAIGGGGAGGLGAFYDVSVEDCTFRRCQRDIHFEFVTGSYLDRVTLDGITSFDARQGSLGLIGARNVLIGDYIVTNPCYAPTSALGDDFPSMTGVVLSSDFGTVKLSKLIIRDTRNSKVRRATDGAITAGSKVFTSASANFTANDIGTFIGIMGANPSGCAYVGKIVSRQSATQVTLDLAAAVTVTGATYAYGGACREGVRVFYGDSLDIDNCSIEAGVGSGLPSETPEAAISIEGVTGYVRMTNTTLSAPTTPGTAACGVRIVDDFAGKYAPGKSNRIMGFGAQYIGIQSHAGSVETDYYRSPPGSVSAPSATIDTYGAAVEMKPATGPFAGVTSGAVTFSNVGAETATVRLTPLGYDGMSATPIDVTATGSGVVYLTAAQLHNLNQPYGGSTRAIERKAKSSISASGFSAAVELQGRVA